MCGLLYYEEKNGEKNGDTLLTLRITRNENDDVFMTIVIADELGCKC